MACRWPACSACCPASGSGSIPTGLITTTSGCSMGRATILGAVLGSGSYVHVPAGVEHDIDATVTEGCRVFYLYSHPGAQPDGA